MDWKGGLWDRENLTELGPREKEASTILKNALTKYLQDSHLNRQESELKFTKTKLVLRIYAI